MLSDLEGQEIKAELYHYEQKRAACITALKIVQRHRGWVSDENIHAIAGLLEVTPDELDSVASFYNLIFRQPVGKHVILLCDSVSCWIWDRVIAWSYACIAVPGVICAAKRPAC
jgi:NADH-quinone oxidoreductase subunit E